MKPKKSGGSKPRFSTMGTKCFSFSKEPSALSPDNAKLANLISRRATAQKAFGACLECRRCDTLNQAHTADRILDGASLTARTIPLRMSASYGALLDSECIEQRTEWTTH